MWKEWLRLLTGCTINNHLRDNCIHILLTGQPASTSALLCTSSQVLRAYFFFFESFGQFDEILVIFDDGRSDEADDAHFVIFALTMLKSQMRHSNGRGEWYLAGRLHLDRNHIQYLTCYTIERTQLWKRRFGLSSVCPPLTSQVLTIVIIISITAPNLCSLSGIANLMKLGHDPAGLGGECVEDFDALPRHRQKTDVVLGIGPRLALTN